MPGLLGGEREADRQQSLQGLPRQALHPAPEALPYRPLQIIRDVRESRGYSVMV